MNWTSTCIIYSISEAGHFLLFYFSVSDFTEDALVDKHCLQINV